MKRNTKIGPQVQGKDKPQIKGLHLLLSAAGICLLYAVVSTQTAAHLMQYSPALGLNLFHIYPPWDYWTWTDKWQYQAPKVFQCASSLAQLISLIFTGIFLLGISNARSNINPFLHGSARWANEKDLKKAGLLNNNGVYVGAWKRKNGTPIYLRHNGPEHVLAYAPTRSGKGISMIIPTLLSWRESVFVTDLKGELYAMTAGWRKEHAKNKVLRFEPASPFNTCHFNPMAEIRIRTEYEVADAQNMALLLVDPKGRGVQEGDHWLKTAYALLTGCIVHLCYKSGANPSLIASLGELDKMLGDPKDASEVLWKEMINNPFCDSNGNRPHPVIAMAAGDMLKKAPPERSSVVSSVKTYLDLFRDPIIVKNTNDSDFRISDLMNHADPVSLYVITQPNDKARLRPLLRIIVNMMLRQLAQRLEFENQRPKASYKHRLLGMIDEFPSLGKLEILQDSLAFVAGYGIKLYLIAQDINQLKSRDLGYGPDETITSNCHVQWAFCPNRLETAQHLSGLTGTTTVIRDATTISGRGWSTQRSTTRQETARPLLTPDEALRMPAAVKDEHDRIIAPGDMILYVAGFPAIYGRQPLFFEDNVFLARSKVHPPIRTDKL